VSKRKSPFKASAASDRRRQRLSFDEAQAAIALIAANEAKANGQSPPSSPEVPRRSLSDEDDDVPLAQLRSPRADSALEDRKGLLPRAVGDDRKMSLDLQRFGTVYIHIFLLASR